MDPASIMNSAAVGWLMSSLVDKAVTALLEAWAKRINIGNEFETLKEQLLQLGALLTSSHVLRTNNRFLEELVQNLQQLAYRAENLLDEMDYYRLQDEIQQRAESYSSGLWIASRTVLLQLKMISRRFVPYVVVALPKTPFPIINLSRKMNELAEQLQRSEEKVRKALETESVVLTARNIKISQTEATNLHQTTSFPTEPIVFGRDKERDQLKNLLTNEESAIVGKVPVVAIVGSGGVGKTTLARLVYDDPKVHSYFEVRLWICVSTQFGIDRLTREMLECACDNKYGNLRNLDTVQKKLKDELVSKRFLLVLDDMWEDEDKNQWDSMVAPLNKCMVKGSIILVTTRKQSVAKMVNARDNIYLQGLDKNAFLSFFSTCIFNDPNFGGKWSFEKIGQEIANKLKGNPLAARTVSALLKEKLDGRYWMKIRDSKEWKSQSGPNDIMPALRLSYEHMPFHLQRCFSYCAIFPEDHSFKVEELVYLWMAQGFLDVRSEGARKEDIGSAYFHDLFNRGFFQTKQSTYGGLVYYTFHDLIRDLACMVAIKECLSIDGPVPENIPPTIRHLSNFSSTKQANLQTIIQALASLNGDNPSTIIYWDELPSDIFPTVLDLLKKTKFLRALSLNLCSQVQPQNFNYKKFVSLRYLRLIMSNFNSCITLPSEICRLYHLEVFEIEANLEELPNNFSDLVSLRHFIVNGKLHSKILDVGKLISLQELKQFVVQQKTGFEIEQLGSLKEIGGSLNINNLHNVKSMAEASKARLEEKKKLDVLYLGWNHGVQEDESVLEGLKPNNNLKTLTIDGYGGVASPRWLASLISLESLTLKGCKEWETLPPIGDLMFLKYLGLSGLAVREIGPQCYGTHHSRKFPSLNKLEIIDMPDLEKWVWSDQHLLFPCLKKLRIQNCTKLWDLPLSGCATSEVLERFPSLESLKIKDCPLISQLPPLPYSSLLCKISIERTGIIKLMHYVEKRKQLSLIQDQSSSLDVVDVLAFHKIRSLCSLNITNMSSLESLDLHSFMALEELFIKKCQSLTSLKFGEHLVCLNTLKIISCETLSSMEGLKSWVNLERLHFFKSPGFIAAWDSASKEIARTEPGFSLPLKIIQGDSLSLLTMPICKQLTSLETFKLEFSAFTKEDEVSPQHVTSIHFVDIRGCKKNLQSFPFDCFPCLQNLWMKFPRIRLLSAIKYMEITEECLKLRNIKKVNFYESPVRVII